MALKKSLQIDHKSYSEYLPFSLVVIFQREGVFDEMVTEASKQYPSLETLRLESIKEKVISFVYNPEPGNIIFLFANDEMTIDVLVHECVHIVMRIFNTIGADMNQETEEFFAYLQDMTFRDIYKVLTSKFKFTPKVLFTNPGNSTVKH